VEIGFVDKAGLRRWTAGGPAAVPRGEIACIPAKFKETSACPTVVIFNNSSDTLTLSFTSDSEDFSVGEHQRLGFVHGPQPCYQNTPLKAGARCYAPVLFWPRTGEVHRATIHVTALGTTGSTSASFKVVGTSDYPPEMEAAEKARQRHAAELKRIPHVASVELDRDKQGEIKINVTVMDGEDIEDVRRQVPPQIEGYETEVTEYIHHAYFL
jgi:hypothetical protein